MKSLFPEEQLTNKAADQPWMKSETDKMLDLYFGGAHPARIAVLLKRNAKAVTRRIEEFTYNERDRVLRYEPRQRISRKGKRITENEQLIVKAHSERNIAPKETAKVLQRDVSEITDNTKEKADAIQIRQRICQGIGVDLLLAYRYQYYVAKNPIVSDKTYDDLKAEEMEFGTGAQILSQPASDRVIDYAPEIRSLAYYLWIRLPDRSPRYAIAERGEQEYQFWSGPFPTVNECFEQSGKTRRSRILELTKDGKRVIAKWNGLKWIFKPNWNNESPASP